MRIVRYSTDGTDGDVRAGVVEGEVVRDAGPDPLAPQSGGATVPLAEVRLHAPVRPPGKVVCVGLNYRDHVEESGAPLPDRPQLFAKWANAVIGPGEPIVAHAISERIDYEGELVVVIGRTARQVEVGDALTHVFGYTCGNDVSGRDLQFGDTQWTRGKALDTWAPLGPWIVTADEIPDPQALGLRCSVNGRTMQDSSTAEMIFGVAEIIAFASQAITLDPGDVIMTGTPSGVGFARNPPVFLRPGDRVRVEIERIGALENPVVAASE